ncbi:hypothetical protein ME763_09570 [Streptomyces murinus]|uniref:hypothetical protein n=1 Tax=Streptomyces murinus TaxID=33900 RepID=UPI00117FAC27|nr:hypothetical protein [Streptomyces murinus]WDO05893.1 hypothetical protein ME763_09570 [Streptomyces murinus]
MTAISFLARVAVTGTVAGLGLGSSADQVRDALGDQCVADRRKKSLRLDYGLLEFSLFAGFCEGIAIQVHRLTGRPEQVIPDALRPFLSGLSRTVSFEALRSEIERDGSYFLEELQGQSGYRCYRVARSHVVLFVVDEFASEGELLAPGDLWSIMISGRS